MNGKITVAEAWLSQLKASGVDYFFANAGTDFPSIVEAFAAAGREGSAPLPRPVLCPHENTAVGMAHGYAMVTGRAQAAMVHVNVGTANAINGLINAERDHVPMLLAAGMTPLHEDGVPGARNLNIHWAQDMFDQAGMVRETVRASFELRDARLAESTTERALALAHSHPAGPVYMMLPRETLAEPAAAPGQARIAPASAGAPSPADIAALATMLETARNPLIITARAGADHAVPDLLARLAERLGAPVVEFRPRHLNLDQQHPLHGGFEVAPWLDDADLILVLECDVPWIPALARPRPDARIVQIGEDPIHVRYPLRRFASDLSIKSGAGAFLSAMLAALPETAPPGGTARAACADLRRRTGAIPDAADGLTARYISYCLDQARQKGSVLVNEYPLVREVMNTGSPGEFYGSSPAGGLGWGVPAALGAKLADPDREVIVGVGDGSFIFCNPIATLQVAAAEKIAVLVLIYNNGGWRAVDRATRSLYPAGQAASANVMPLTRFDPVPQYAPIAEACGVYGETVEDARALPAALARAFAEVRAGRTAVLDVLSIS